MNRPKMYDEVSGMSWRIVMVQLPIARDLGFDTMIASFQSLKNSYVELDVYCCIMRYKLVAYKSSNVF